jgi:hypothetical protein
LHCIDPWLSKFHVNGNVLDSQLLVEKRPDSAASRLAQRRGIEFGAQDAGKRLMNSIGWIHPGVLLLAFVVAAIFALRMVLPVPKDPPRDGGAVGGGGEGMGH